MSSQTPSQKLFSDLEFKSGAMMWFSSTLDTNSPWGSTYPVSSFPAILPSTVAAPKKQEQEVKVQEISKASKSVQQFFSSNEFVQVSSNQRWNAQNIRFGSVQTEMTKKTSTKVTSIVPTPTAVIPSPSEHAFPSLPIETELEEAAATQNLYKTEYCRSFEETGSCRYGMKCQFAHGSAELRPVTRHPKYKTEVCKTFHSIGTCPYGKRCRFIHIEAPSNVQHSSPSVQKALPSKHDSIKPAPAKQSTFENINGSGWSNNWNGSFASTNVNFNNNVVAAPKGFSQKAPIEQFSSPVNVSKDGPVLERRSRLGIFQQICS